MIWILAGIVIGIIATLGYGAWHNNQDEMEMERMITREEILSDWDDLEARR